MAKICAFHIELSIIAAQRREAGPQLIASSPAVTLRLVGLRSVPVNNPTVETAADRPPGRRRRRRIGQQILVMQDHVRARRHFGLQHRVQGEGAEAEISPKGRVK